MPAAPFVIATIGFGGWKMSGPHKTVAEAQLAVSGDRGNYPEFKGNVTTVETRDFWREPEVSPKNQGFHYNQNAETYMLVGEAMGKGMLERKSGNIIHIDSIEANMQLNGAARPYAVAKAAVQQLTRMHARQLGPYNIRVNSLCTGAVETDMGFHNMWYAGKKDRPAALDNPDRKLFGPGTLDNYVPLGGRAGEPIEIANTMRASWIKSD